ncbi:response regulator [Candidatus Dojkabacteria bacterium]|nr:response regulator [Candidatus Dojkabacteria bacterium]
MATEQVSEEAKETVGNTTLIAVIDDEPSISDVVVRVLMKPDYGGFTNISTHCGNVGLIEQWQEKGMPGLVITDVMMPYRNGIDFVEALFQHCTRHGMPKPKVIVMSSEMLLPVKEKLLHIQQVEGESNVAFIEKPFRVAELADAVRCVLDMKG